MRSWDTFASGDRRCQHPRRWGGARPRLCARIARRTSMSRQAMQEVYARLLTWDVSTNEATIFAERRQDSAAEAWKGPGLIAGARDGLSGSCCVRAASHVS